MIPSEDRIFVIRDKQEEKTSSGIYIPDTAKERPMTGTVAAKGPGKYAETTGNLIPVRFTAGDRVMFSKHGGSEMTVDGQDYIVLRPADIFCTL